MISVVRLIFIFSVSGSQMNKNRVSPFLRKFLSRIVGGDNKKFDEANDLRFDLLISDPSLTI